MAPIIGLCIRQKMLNNIKHLGWGIVKHTYHDNMNLSVDIFRHPMMIQRLLVRDRYVIDVPHSHVSLHSIKHNILHDNSDAINSDIVLEDNNKKLCTRYNVTHYSGREGVVDVYLCDNYASDNEAQLRVDITRRTMIPSIVLSLLSYLIA